MIVLQTPRSKMNAAFLFKYLNPKSSLVAKS